MASSGSAQKLRSPMDKSPVRPVINPRPSDNCGHSVSSWQSKTHKTRIQSFALFLVSESCVIKGKYSCRKVKKWHRWAFCIFYNKIFVKVNRDVLLLAFSLLPCLPCPIGGVINNNRMISAVRRNDCLISYCANAIEGLKIRYTFLIIDYSDLFIS